MSLERLADLPRFLRANGSLVLAVIVEEELASFRAAVAFRESGVLMNHRFPIGTRYIGKGCVCTVTDHLTTTNSRGEVVSRRYVATHTFMGQSVADSDVCDTTIARNLIA